MTKSLLTLLEPKPPLKRWALIAAALGYCLSPIDLMPEAFLGPFGLGDDAAAAIVLLRHLMFPGRVKPATT